MIRLSCSLIISLLLSSTLSAQEPLTFDSAYCQIANSSFELQTLAAAASAKSGEQWQASLYPNPILNIGVDTFYTPSEGSQECFLGITQLFELGGKRCARVNVANALYDVACWDFEVARQDLFEETLQTFIDVAVAQERVHFALQQQDTADKTLECILVKAEGGKGTAIEVKKGEIACRTSKLFTSKQQALLVEAKSRLQGLWDCSPPTIDRVSYPIYDIVPPPELTPLKEALKSNPQLMKKLAEIDYAQEMISFERSNGIPDIAVQVGVTTERWYHEPTLGFEIDIPLPIFNRNQGNICRASEEYTQAIYSYDDLLAQLEAHLTTLYAGWEAAYHHVITIKDEIMPLVNENYALAQMSYEEGKIDYLALLDAKSALFTLQQEYLDALEDYHHKQAGIAALTTLPKSE